MLGSVIEAYLARVGLVDHHAHSLATEEAWGDISLESVMTEARGTALLVQASSVPAQTRARRILQLLYGVQDPDDLDDCRARLGLVGTARKCFEGQSVRALFVDDGVPSPKLRPLSAVASLLPAGIPVHRIVRAEDVLEQILTLCRAVVVAQTDAAQQARSPPAPLPMPPMVPPVPPPPPPPPPRKISSHPTATFAHSSVAATMAAANAGRFWSEPGELRPALSMQSSASARALTTPAFAAHSPASALARALGPACVDAVSALCAHAALLPSGAVSLPVTAATLTLLGQALAAAVDAAVDAGAVAVKLATAYRAPKGLAVRPREEAEAAARASDDLLVGPGEMRLAGHPILEWLVYQAIEAAASLKVPVQVHTGFGDVDLRLDQSNPLLFLEAIRFADQRGVPLVLLHTSYPFCREASFLCANYACIHLDLSLAIPLLSWAGMTEAVAQCMHLAPICKVMMSTDGHTLPEMFFLAMACGRRVLADVLADMVEGGDLGAEQALQLAADVFVNNAARLYSAAHLQPAPTPTDDDRAAAVALASESRVRLATLVRPGDSATLRSMPMRWPVPSIDSEVGGSGQVLMAERQMGRMSGVRMVRLVWSDSAGVRRCRVVTTASFLSSAVAYGLGLTEGCMGMPHHRDGVVAASGLSTVGEVRLTPDVSTMRQLPWMPSHAVALCDLRRDGRPWECCPRTALKAALRSLRTAHAGLEVLVGSELEFQLFRRAGAGERGVGAGGAGGAEGVEGAGGSGEAWVPVDWNGYCSTAAVESQAPFLNAVADGLKEVGVPVLQMHAESAPGQFEVVLGHLPALEAADALILAREVIAGCASQRGMQASFLPKTAREWAGNASHLHLSLQRGGQPVMAGGAPWEIRPEAEQFFAGIFHRIPALSAFTAPSAASRERVKPGAWAGAYHIWGWQNKEAPLRACGTPHNPAALRDFEYKLSDATANAHLAIAALVACGAAGLAGRETLPPPTAYDPSATDGGANPNHNSNLDPNSQQSPQRLRVLPQTAAEVEAALVEGVGGRTLPAVVGSVVGERLVGAYLAVKRAEWAATEGLPFDSQVRRFLFTF